MALGRLGKYDRVDVLGHGASGIVYLAWDTLLKKQIALKEIDLQAADVNRFLEEARVMDRLTHPNIVRVNGVDRIDGHILIDMEYVKGHNLQQVLRKEGPLPLDRAMDIAIQTLDALDYAHRMRTVHRDIKPANILVGKSGDVKLVDFGLAEILATNSYAGGAGTYAYMAPEDFGEEHHSDHQSDIWAVGVTLFEMITGERPFIVAKAKDPFAWRKVLMTERSRRLADTPSPPGPLSQTAGEGENGQPADTVTCSPVRGGSGQGVDASIGALQAVLDRALARDKSERYQTAGDFRDDLIAIRGGMEPAHYVIPEPLATSVNFRPTADYGTNNHAAPTGPLMLTLEAEPARLPQPSDFVLPDVIAPAAAPIPPRYGELSQQEPAEVVARKSLFRRREALPAKVAVDPQTVHFGDVRKGDERSTRVQVQFEGGEGRPAARVVAAPPWATVYPPVINRRRQSLVITAHTERAWQVGDFADSVRLETTAGSVTIPVTLRVLKPRRRFAEVALWYVPLLVSVLLPALTVAWGSHVAAARYLVPAAVLGSGLLAAMALLVSVEADLGFAEKMICGILLAVMTMVLGVTVGISGRAHNPLGFERLPATGFPFGVLFLIQVVQRRYWKLWAVAIVILAIISSTVFANVLASS